MKVKHGFAMTSVWIVSLLLSSCGLWQIFDLPIAPSPLVTQTPTSKPTFTPSPTFTLTEITQTFTVIVPANILWFDTGLKILNGQKVTIRVTGNVNTWGGRPKSDSDAGGQTTAFCDDWRCPMAGVSYGALIGRLGVGGSFRVDTAFDFIAPDSGELFLSVNDWAFADNSGEFIVTITVK
jgi:hypothetical protein